MAKKELIANDPMETRLMAFSGTVNRVANAIEAVLLIVSVVLGFVLSGVAGDFGVLRLLMLLACILAGVLLAAVVWLIKELICLWLENQVEMHCYARTQTEILMENLENK